MALQASHHNMSTPWIDLSELTIFCLKKLFQKYRKIIVADANIQINNFQNLRSFNYF